MRNAKNILPYINAVCSETFDFLKVSAGTDLINQVIFLIMNNAEYPQRIPPQIRRK